MTKLTPAQAYAAQLKENRRAQAQERRDPVIQADNARINQMFATEVKENSSRVLSWEELPDSVQAQISEIAPKFKELTGVDFPRSVWYDQSDWGGGFTYWVDGNQLPGSFPAFYGRSGRPCAKLNPRKVGGRGYGYRTPAISTVLTRIRKGKTVVASA